MIKTIVKLIGCIAVIPSAFAMSEQKFSCESQLNDMYINYPIEIYQVSYSSQDNSKGSIYITLTEGNSTLGFNNVSINCTLNSESKIILCPQTKISQEINVMFRSENTMGSLIFTDSENRIINIFSCDQEKV